jgi:hypothetical protein
MATTQISENAMTIEECFKDLDIEYSNFHGTIQKANYIESFISTYVKKEVSLKLESFDSTGDYNQLKILGSDQVLVTFRPSNGLYDLGNIYHGGELIINTPHQDTYFYYLKELMKNITFSIYLIYGNNEYAKATKLSNIDISEKMNGFIRDEFTYSFGNPSIEDDGIAYRFSKYSIFISIKIKPEGTLFCFSGRHGVVGNVGDGVYFTKFHDLILHLNNYIYDVTVRKPFDIEPNEFTVRHRELIKMIEI